MAKDTRTWEVVDVQKENQATLAVTLVCKETQEFKIEVYKRAEE